MSMTPHLAGTPTLETDRLILRAPVAADWEPVAAFLADERSQYMGGPYSRHNAWRSFNHVVGHWVVRGYGLFAYCDKATGRALGFVGPWFPEGWAEPEIGWSIWDAADEGKGYVSAAATLARNWVFAAHGWTTAVSYIDAGNARSIALAKRLGCVLDTAAPLPALDDWDGTLVFRHPAPDSDGGMDAYA